MQVLQYNIILIFQTIGWRPLPARHVIIYMSDAQFHLGGDGKVRCSSLNIYVLSTNTVNFH